MKLIFLALLFSVTANFSYANHCTDYSGFKAQVRDYTLQSLEVLCPLMLGQKELKTVEEKYTAWDLEQTAKLVYKLGYVDIKMTIKKADCRRNSSSLELVYLEIKNGCE